MVNGQPIPVYTPAELREMASAVIRLGVFVTPWEQTFMKDMDNKSTFSEKQAELIDNIYTRRTR